MLNLKKSFKKIFFDLKVSKKFYRFCITGLLSTFVHIIVAASSIEFLHLSPSMGNGLAFIVATIVSFTVNSLWSFSVKLTARSGFRFLVVSTSAFFISMILAEWIDRIGLHYAFGIMTVIFVIPIITFIGHNFWTFKQR